MMMLKKYIYLLIRCIIAFSIIQSIILFTEIINAESFYVKYLGYNLTKSSYLNTWFLGMNKTFVFDP